jgi:cytochrome c553
MARRSPGALAAITSALASTVTVTVTITLAACAPSANDPRAAEPPIASVWRARCGACHARVEPGEKSNATLRAAAKRHEKRVHLTADQWDALVAWLSPAAAPATTP